MILSLQTLIREQVNTVRIWWCTNGHSSQTVTKMGYKNLFKRLIAMMDFSNQSLQFKPAFEI